MLYALKLFSRFENLSQPTSYLQGKVQIQNKD